MISFYPIFAPKARLLSLNIVQIQTQLKEGKTDFQTLLLFLEAAYSEIRCAFLLTARENKQLIGRTNCA